MTAPARTPLGRTRLGAMLDAYQWMVRIDGKSLAEEIGISESTLTRIKQGRMPDAVGLAKIIAWAVGAR